MMLDVKGFIFVMNGELGALLGLLGSGTLPAAAPPSSIPTVSHDKASNQLPRDEMLRLIASQLLFYNFTDAARAVDSSPTLTASPRLAELCFEANRKTAESGQGDGSDPSPAKRARIALSTAPVRPARNPSQYISWFATQHKGVVRGAAFSADGTYFATCSADTSLKVVDVAKIHNCRKDSSSASTDKPVVRTYYDHQGPANDVAFHPNGSTLVSCSDDQTIKLYDLQRVNVKRGYRYLQDACPVRCVSFHPSGDFLLAGTDHECVRIYDIQTFKCFRPTTPAVGELSGSITKAQFSPSGNIFATSSTDGTIRIYDGVGGKLINTITQAHGGASVSSVEFSQNGKWLLSCGLDSLPRVWDLGSGRVVQTFEGSSQRNSSINATFSQKDQLILSVDDVSNSVVVWDAKTGALLQKVSTMHSGPVRSVIASPVDGGFVTVSDDCRARYWFPEENL
ncbi:WD40-repeat-containing domain protein [Chytriomyces sp. MP71]|nr:WD40-repeat-containing domain protein [Chytriomyces sp. MP71]